MKGQEGKGKKEVSVTTLGSLVGNCKGPASSGLRGQLQVYFELQASQREGREVQEARVPPPKFGNLIPAGIENSLPPPSVPPLCRCRTGTVIRKV